MDNRDFNAWCQAATSQIRYKPDRRAVSDELQAHLEDHYDALTARGISPADAAAQALAAMGDPEEIAPQLGAIHRPMLGYFYSFARFTGILTGICALGLSCIYGLNYLHTLISCDRHESYSLYGEDFHKPCVSASADGYRIEIPEAAVDRENGALYFQLEVTYWPWMEEFGALDDFWAVDSAGNRYPPIKNYDLENGVGVKYTGGLQTGGIHVYSMKLDGFDCDARWVELCYDRDGRDIVLRIDLTGGAEE